MLYCGASGWSRQDWNGVVFPTLPPRGFHPLEFLAQRVNLLEVDRSFHRPLRPEVTHVWARKVEANRDFRFAVQLARQFTHERNLDAADIKAFKDGLWPLMKLKRLGCLIMRFPWNFRFTTVNRDFLVELRRTFHEFPLVAEVRHTSWQYDEALGTLMDYKIGYCNVDQPEGLKAAPPTALITSAVGYVRLLGRGGDDWMDETASANYFYTPRELGAWQARIERVNQFATATYVVLANSVAGRSMMNAMQLRSMLETAPPKVVVPRREIAPPIRTYESLPISA